MRPRHLVVAVVAFCGLLLTVVPFVARAQASTDVPSGSTTTACEGDHWIAAWIAAPQSSSLGRADDVDFGLADGAARTFHDQSLRMIVTPHVAGSAVRVHVGNRYGITALAVDAITIGVRDTGAAMVPGSVARLTFGGRRAVTIAAGSDAISDPVNVDVVPFRDLAVSFHVVGTAPLDYHQWAQATNYVTPVGSGDHAGDGSGSAYTEEVTSSYAIGAVDVLAPRSTGVMATLGDSITDGVGSTPNTNQRWPDDLAHRLLTDGVGLSVINAGIAGNHVATSGLTSVAAIGPSAAQRVQRDALSQAGVTDLFVYEGINDIFRSEPGSDVASKVIDGYRAIIQRAHAAGVRVSASTVTPAAMTGEKEAARQTINGWIRSSGAFDAVVDFDSIARDPGKPSTVRPDFDAYLAHLTDAGYRALADSIDLSVFQGTGC